MMSFTTFTLIISVITLLLSLVFFCVEVFVFRWANWDSWLAEQTFMRALEACYSVGVLWFLRRVPPHEVIPERRALWTPDQRHVVHKPSDDSSTSVEEDDFSIRRKLSSSFDKVVEV